MEKAKDEIFERIQKKKQKRKDMRLAHEDEMLEWEKKKFENMKNEFINDERAYLIR